MNVSSADPAVPDLSAVRFVVIGAIAGMAAGVVTGGIEACYLLLLTASSDTSIIPFAFGLYGAVGLVLGLGLAAGIRILGLAWGRVRQLLDPGPFIFSTVASLFLLAVGLQKINKDLLKEAESKVGLVWIGSVLVFIVLAGAFVLLLHRILSARKSFSRPGRVFIICLGLLVCTSAVQPLINRCRLSEAPGYPQARLTAGDPGDGALPPVILLIVDTLRADYLSCYDYPGETTTPSVDALARDGILFENTLAQSSWTKPSIATILTSLYPSSHQAIHKSSVLPEDVVSVAEVLRESGYRTTGIVSNINIAPIFNFQQGFDFYEFLEPDYFLGATQTSSRLFLFRLLKMIYEFSPGRSRYINQYYQSAETVTERVIHWLDLNMESPFFLLVHYMDPHAPYFSHPQDGAPIAPTGELDAGAGDIKRFTLAYSGEVAYCDVWIGRLMQYLRDQGVYDEAIIVFTADHGEEFYEHQGWWHGKTLYEEQIRVPLIFKLPGSKMAGRRISPTVALTDIAPTILALTGLDTGNPDGWQGRCLVTAYGELPDHVEGQPGGPVAVPGGSRPLFAEEEFEGCRLRSLHSENWKIILANEDNPQGLEPVELYDLEQDPGEQQNLWDGASTNALISALIEECDEARRIAASASVAAQSEDLDQATRERLEALGYVQ